MYILLESPLGSQDVMPGSETRGIGFEEATGIFTSQIRGYPAGR